MQQLMILLCFLVLVGCESQPTNTSVNNNTQIIPPCSLNSKEQQLLNEINNIRRQGVQCGDVSKPSVQPLYLNCLLNQAANIHVDDMTTNNFFAHIGSNGLTAEFRLQQVGYEWSYYGENLGAGYISPTEVLQAMIDSTPHCTILMNPNYTEIGIVYRYDTDTYYKRYWVVLLGTPLY